MSSSPAPYPPLRIGVVGCGNISRQYFEAASTFELLDITACADLNAQAAQKAADEFGVPRVLSVDDLIASDEVDAVLNLTIPAAHVPIGLKALAAGKHVYAEKPLGVDFAEGKKLFDAAAQAGLRLGNAPDTFLGTGQQTARQAIDDGLIGRPLSFTAFMMCPGHESWHPSPAFYYQQGGGPMLDMGPYYLTALVNLFGGIEQVAAFTDIQINPRTIAHGGADNPGPMFGQTIDVETPDHYTGILRHRAGVIGNLVMSFAVQHAQHDGSHPITVYGDQGTLKVPDPNNFDGSVLLRRTGEDSFAELPDATPTGFGRSVGLADLAQAIRADRPHRCSAELSLHVLEAMQGFLDSGRTREFVTMTTDAERPAALPAKLPGGLLDD